MTPPKESPGPVTDEVGALQRKIQEYERWFRFLDGQNRVLERERQKLSAVLNHTDAGFLVLDASLHVVWANDVFRARFDASHHPGAVVGSDCNRVLCGRDSPCDTCPARKPFASSSVAHHEVTLEIEGRPRHVYATAMPIKSPFGDTEETILMLQDVSDLEVLRQSGEALRAKEERLRSSLEELRESRRRLDLLLEQMPAVLWTTDRSLRFTSSTGAGLGSLKRRPPQVIGMSLQEYFGTEDPRFPPIAAHARAVAGEPVSYEISWQGCDFAVHVEPFHGADGAIVGAIGVALDITGRKAAETALTRKEARLRRQQTALLDLVSEEAFGMGDPQKVLERISETAARVLDVERASLWLYSEDRSRISCRDLYRRADDGHSSGLELTAASHPAFFAALEESRSIAATDARSDPRTAELWRSYLEAQGVGSVLNAPIWLAGRTIGALCLEHVGEPRSWEVDEEYFSASLANVVSLAVNQWQARRFEEALWRTLAEKDSAKEALKASEAARGGPEADGAERG